MVRKKTETSNYSKKCFLNVHLTPAGVFSSHPIHHCSPDTNNEVKNVRPCQREFIFFFFFVLFRINNRYLLPSKTCCLIEMVHGRGKKSYRKKESAGNICYDKYQTTTTTAVAPSATQLIGRLLAFSSLGDTNHQRRRLSVRRAGLLMMRSLSALASLSLFFCRRADAFVSEHQPTNTHTHKHTEVLPRPSSSPANEQGHAELTFVYPRAASADDWRQRRTIVVPAVV